MNDLPVPPGNNPPPPPPVTSPGIGGKEKEIGLTPTEPVMQPVVVETEVSPEVASAGVKVQPTTIPISPPVAQAGVQPIGQNVPPPAQSVTLPLSDDQIAQGLKQSIWTSWRWLAQWCVRRLKQVHMGLKNIHGKLIRVRQ